MTSELSGICFVFHSFKVVSLKVRGSIHLEALWSTCLHHRSNEKMLMYQLYEIAYVVHFRWALLVIYNLF